MAGKTSKKSAKVVRRGDKRDVARRLDPPAVRMGKAPLISLMLAVPDAQAAASWYQRALGAKVLWSLGSVIGLEIEGAPFFVGQPENNGWATPRTLGMPSCRIEVFCDDPDGLVARALKEDALLRHGRKVQDPMRVHRMPWGPHRQGGFVDPFGHIWLVGDRSPLKPYPR